MNQTGKKKKTENTSPKKTGYTLYTVKTGDCLWNIAIKFYGKGKGYLYTKIYNANKDKIKNNKLIRNNKK